MEGMLGFMDAPAFFKDTPTQPVKPKRSGASAAEAKRLKEEKRLKELEKDLARKMKPYLQQRAVLTKQIFGKLLYKGLSRQRPIALYAT